MYIASVIVDVPARTLSEPFDYAVPANMPAPQCGCAVSVNFGNRPVIGYVVSVAEQDSPAEASSAPTLASAPAPAAVPAPAPAAAPAPADQPAPTAQAPRALKPILQVLSEPYFDASALEIARFIAREYNAPFIEALRLFFPPHGTHKVVRDKETGEWIVQSPQAKPADDRWVSLLDQDFVPPARAVKQRAIIEALREGPLRMPELCAEVGAANAACTLLEKRGILAIENRRRFRGSAQTSAKERNINELTQGQRNALDAIAAALDRAQGDTILIDGVTSSGKTEVYLRAIRRVLDAGGQACVLVPEISLTPQTVGRFRARFGDAVAVLHSRLSAGERFDQWDLVRSGEAKVVVGARSALFAPFSNLKLIVIDEEHEFTFKQESSPRYVARTVAREMARVRHATVVLGSATPSYEALCDPTIMRIEMPERAGAGQVPTVEVIDMAREFETANRSMFSRRLQECLKETLAREEKAVLFLNRRGFASFLLCRECGYTPQCDSCSVSYTYHEYSNQLECHHCDAHVPVPVVCPKCGSPYLRKFGAGTERVEAELRALVGENIPIIRMDADTTKRKGAHEELLQEFDAAPSAILLGTQMIAKGLDYPKVTLVGVMNADTTLNLPDFRAAERSFQLLEQVSGRAGRGDLPGRVIIQTYAATHPAVRAVALHDRSILTNFELPLRAQLGYPPYTRLVNVLVSGEREAEVTRTAREFALVLSNVCARIAGQELYAGAEFAEASSSLLHAWEVVGPSACVLEKLKSTYRWHILLKCPLKMDIPAAIEQAMKSYKAPASTRIVFDVDPMSLM